MKGLEQIQERKLREILEIQLTDRKTHMDFFPMLGNLMLELQSLNTNHQLGVPCQANENKPSSKPLFTDKLYRVKESPLARAKPCHKYQLRPIFVRANIFTWEDL